MPDTLHVLLSGSSGLIGTALFERLTADGHRVTRLVRGDATGSGEVHWTAHTLDPSVLEGVDAVINLSGASVGRIPWTPGYRRTLVRSRVDPTRALAEAIVAAPTPPAVFISGSAVGFYGDRPGETLTDTSTRGTGFFPDLVEAWEHAAAIAAGDTRVVTIRTAVVVARGGGLGPVQLLTRFGLGSRFGSGRQYWPWISLQDEVSAIVHLLTSSLSGAVVLAGPNAATSGEITRAFADAAGKPYALRVPEFAVKVLGEAGQRLLLDDMHVEPDRLAADGFVWQHRTIADAIAAIPDSARA